MLVLLVGRSWTLAEMVPAPMPAMRGADRDDVAAQVVGHESRGAAFCVEGGRAAVSIFGVDNHDSRLGMVAMMTAGRAASTGDRQEP